jgi:two-component system, NarL family, sensor histidine kinase DesK
MRAAFLSRRTSDQPGWLLWLQGALAGYLFLTAARIELMHLFAGYWVVRLPWIYRLRATVMLTLAVIILSQVITVVRGEALELSRIVVMVPLYSLALFISHMAASERRLYLRTHTLNQELKIAQERLAEAATQAERLRIAREMHDLLGHQMTVQMLNLEIARHHAQGVALSHVERSLALGKTMLGDLRASVRDLREGRQANFAEALRNLLARVPGLQTNVEIPEDLVIDDPRQAAVLLRCVQEATTNTLRHSGATRFDVALHVAEGQLLMEMTDDGNSQAQIVPGNGLSGMRERVEAFAGRLDWQTLHGSLKLTVTLPLSLSPTR